MTQRMRVVWFAPLAALIAILLAGCPTVPRKPEPPEKPWPERRAELQQRNAFELRARLAVAAGNEGFNARLRWQQQGEHSELALDGPLGVGGVRVVSDGASVSVTTSQGRQLDNEAAMAEVQKRLGFEPPLGSLRYWVLGAPDPSVPANEELDDRQRLQRLEQNGWQIEYGSYMAGPDGWLPERLTLRRENVRVRLIVDSWVS